MEPHRVEMTNGWTWYTCGWRLFASDALMWVVLSILYLVVAIILNLVPLLGPLALALLTPALYGGVLYAARTVQEGGRVDVMHLFQGLSDTQRRGPLLTLGAVVLGLEVIIGLLALLLVGGGVLAGGGLDPDTATATVGIGVLLGLLLVLTLVLILTMAVLYAVPLVMFDDVKPVQALSSSIRACLVNFLPLTVAGLVYIVLFFAAIIPVMLGFLVLIPVTFTAVYCSYQNIYHDG